MKRILYLINFLIILIPLISQATETNNKNFQKTSYSVEINVCPIECSGSTFHLHVENLNHLRQVLKTKNISRIRIGWETQGNKVSYQTEWIGVEELNQDHLDSLNEIHQGGGALIVVEHWSP